MKILLLCKGRVGSYSIMEWLCDELGLVLFDNEQVNINDDYIVKISDEFYDINEYDKIIRLYREDTLNQSISSSYAYFKQQWHHTNGTYDGFYEINSDFLLTYHDEIWKNKLSYDEQNLEIKNFNYGLLISYEDVFDRGIGQKLIEDYIGFVSEVNLIDENKRLRKDYTMNKVCYENRINELTNNIVLLETKIDNLNELMSETINSYEKTLLFKNNKIDEINNMLDGIHKQISIHKKNRLL